MTQALTKPNTSRKLSKLVVWRALVIPTNWTLSKAVQLLKSNREDCRFILINNKYFVRADTEYEQEYNEPFVCFVPPPELLNEWNRTRFVKGD